MTAESKDLLYLVLSFSIVWLTVFLCVLLYYVIRMVKHIEHTTKQVKEKIEKATSVVEVLKNKAFSAGAKSVGDFVMKALKNKKKK